MRGGNSSTDGLLHGLDRYTGRFAGGDPWLFALPLVLFCGNKDREIILNS